MRPDDKLAGIFLRLDQVRGWTENDKSFLDELLGKSTIVEQIERAVDGLENLYCSSCIAMGTTRSHPIEDE